MSYKICTRCNRRLPSTTEYFYKRNKGLQSMCKPCQNNYNRKYIREYTKLGRREQSLQKRSTEYALYKGEKLLAIGTLAEISEELNVTASTILFYSTPTYKKRTSEENGRRLVKLD